MILDLKSNTLALSQNELDYIVAFLELGLYGPHYSLQFLLETFKLISVWYFALLANCLKPGPVRFCV
jgi:thiamine transporter ThiT